MSAAVDFHSQIASIMEVLANAAVAEICKVLDDGYVVVHLEMSRSQKENEFLRRKVKLLELQIARHRAERLRGAEASINSRFSAVRLLNRQSKDSPAGPSLLGRTRFLNRGKGTQQQCVQKNQPINLDQDLDQDVLTTTKTESAELEEDGELLIIKLEGAMETTGTANEAPTDPGIVTGGGTNSTTSRRATSRDRSDGQPTRCRSLTEVSGSDVMTFGVGRTAETHGGRDTTHGLLLTGSDVRAGEIQPSNLDSRVITSRDAVPTSCIDITDSRNANVAALDSSKSSLSEVIVIHEGGMSNKEGQECEWLHVDQTNREASSGRPEQTTLTLIQCAGLESARHRSAQERSALPLDDPPGTSSSNNCDTPSLVLLCSAPPHKHTHNHSHNKPISRRCHPALHTMHRPFGCTTCTKRFFLQSDLQKHMARHTRQKPYTCVVCSKSFVCQSQLDIHRNVHTGEKPFRCSVCNQCFSHPSNLKRHEKIQH